MSRRSHYGDLGFARGKISSNKAVAEIRQMGEHVLKAAKVALKKGADAVVADAKNRCLVNTGRLRNSIKAESNRDGSVYWITANASVESKKSPSGRFYYGAVVEFSPKINRPFLYPAMEQNRQQIEDDISAAISKATRSG